MFKIGTTTVQNTAAFSRQKSYLNMIIMKNIENVIIQKHNYLLQKLLLLFENILSLAD